MFIGFKFFQWIRTKIWNNLLDDVRFLNYYSLLEFLKTGMKTLN